jgi:hypothetical protein
MACGRHVTRNVRVDAYPASPMSRDLPNQISAPRESGVTSVDHVSNTRRPRHLSVLPDAERATSRLTRGQVAARLSISISTVRRYEGDKLHPMIDEHDVRWFDANEVAALAATLANEAGPKRPENASSARAPEPRSAGEIAGLVFERFEQRQSLPEIVIGLRVEPETVRALFEQWCLGLVEHQLRMEREPRMPRSYEIERARVEKLGARLSELPDGVLTRISVARFREEFQHGEHEYLRIDELGGFYISGPCRIEDITRRFGPGSYRVTAYGFDPPGLRWELLVEGLGAA